MKGLHFYTIGIAIASGIFTRSFFDLGWGGTGLLFVVGIACFFAGRLKTRGFESPLFLVALACFAGAIGMARLNMDEDLRSPFSEYEGERVSIDARIVREPDIRETTVQLYVKPLSYDTNELLLVTADRFSYNENDLQYGRVVRAEGTLVRPHAFETDNGRLFEYEGFLKARGVRYSMQFAEVTLLSEGERSLFTYLYAGKRRFISSLERSIPEPESGLGEGILLGVKRALGDGLEETFRETGIIHIVVLSGYNVMIVVESIMYLLAFAFFPRTRMIVGGIAIFLFALLVGFSATVVRASIMAFLLLIARGTGRTYAVLRALMLAGIIMLLINPHLLVHDPGFQLSFLATLGLILLSPHIEKQLTKIPETAGMRGFMTATMATQIFVLPLLLYHTGMFSVVTLLVNVLVLPVVPVAMFLTFLTGMVGIVSSVAGIGLGFLTYVVLGYIIWIAQIFGSLPFASFSVPVFPFWIVALIYALLAYVIVLLVRKESTVPTSSHDDLHADWTIIEESDMRKTNTALNTQLPFR